MASATRCSSSRTGLQRSPGDRGVLPALRAATLLAHHMRNLAVKVPTDLWPEFKARASACYQARSDIARDLAKGIGADYGTLLPSAVACFEDDFEACIAHLRLPVTHRRSTRTTNAP